MSRRRQWSDLPPELLVVVSALLHDVADYVRLHAVCKPWRESLPASTALRPIFFPWIVYPPSRCDPLHIKLRCIFSKKSYRAVTPTGFSWHDWVARADGMAAWFSASPKPTLVNPFTGDAISLPPFVGDDDGKAEWGTENSGRILYGDGTVFLYNFHHNFFSEWVLEEEDEEELTEIVRWSTSFRAAILHPGDTAWRFVNRLIDLDVEEQILRKDSFFAAYNVYGGKTLVHVDGYYRDSCCWHILPPPDASQDKSVMTWKIRQDEVVVTIDWNLESSHVLESRGELLQVSVLTQRFVGQPGPQQVSVLVHALEEEVDADGRHTLHWVRREGLSFADRVMFLGSKTSFAVEASRFHGEVSGGWVYFLQRTSYVYEQSLPKPLVFRYNLVDGKAEFMERLPLELEIIDREDDEPFMWLMPQPAIAPIQVIRERLESPETGVQSLKISTIPMEEPKQSKD
ncbi:unnamed protein product [Alopecurus aequalis]